MIPTIPSTKDRRFRCLQQASWAAESKAYFAALATNGVTATQAQRDAYNIFIAAGKREGWLSGIQRMFIPVWGVAAANAVDAILPSRSGTWVGTVTHTGKAATGDGTTGYLDMVLNTPVMRPSWMRQILGSPSQPVSDFPSKRVMTSVEAAGGTSAAEDGRRGRNRLKPNAKGSKAGWSGFICCR